MKRASIATLFILGVSGAGMAAFNAPPVFGGEAPASATQPSSADSKHPESESRLKTALADIIRRNSELKSKLDDLIIHGNDPTPQANDDVRLGDAILQLAQYAMLQGKEAEVRAAESKDAKEREGISRQARAFFRSSADAFTKFAQLFPNDGSTTHAICKAGGCYVRAQEFDKAIEAFKRVIDDPNSDRESIAFAIYWIGDINMNKPKRDYQAAYAAFKRVTQEFPESQYAKFASGRLTEEVLVRIDDAKPKTNLQ